MPSETHQRFVGPGPSPRARRRGSPSAGTRDVRGSPGRWRSQQLSRNLSFTTIANGERVVQRFQDHAGSFPWGWTSEEFEAWISGLRKTSRALSTVRAYEMGVHSFLSYACDPAYGWAEACLKRFGTHPTQICTETNLAVHASDNEGRPTRRSLTASMPGPLRSNQQEGRGGKP